jgi:hypothetical protein
MTQCHACFGKGSASVFVNEVSHGDFIGQTTSRKSYVAERKCKHCKATGQCDCKKCEEYPKK